MNLPYIKTCEECHRVYDYKECPFCLARKKKEEKRGVKYAKIQM